MKIAPFETEHFFARYEFTTPYQLCNSDCETVSVAELLQMVEVPLEEFGRLTLGYTEAPGNPELRAAIAAAYPRVSAEEVMVLGTPVEGIYITARAALEPGDEVIVLSPAYDALINVFEHVVGPQNVRKWAFVPAEGEWRLDFDQLIDLITPRTRMLVVNFPHNPTGYLPTPEQFTQIVDLAERHTLVLLCDEMYAGLTHFGTPSIPSAASLTDRAVVLSGLSKTYGLPGLRTGWLVVRDPALRQTVFNWKFYTSICPPAPSEFLALAAWKVREQLRQRSIAQVEANLRLADAFFERWPGLFAWRRPKAGSVALVGMDVSSVSAYAEKMAQEAGVLLLPGGSLGAGDQHFRMGFGRRGFAPALEQFEAYLRRSFR